MPRLQLFPRVLLVIAYSALAPYTLCALNPHKSVTQYTRSEWTQAEGLPASTINAIAQTSAGYLWLGTDDGLSRFDGFEFVNYTKENCDLPSNSVSVLATGNDDSLWIGTANGLVRYRDGRFRTFTQRDGLPENVIQALFVDHEGKVWIGAGGGLSRFDGMAFITISPESLYPVRRVRAIYEDQSHNLMIAGFGGLVMRTGGGFVPVIKRDEMAEDVTSIKDRNGSFWLGGWHGLLRMTPDGKNTVPFGPLDGLPSDNVRVIDEDREGNVWLGTTGGLARFDHDRFVIVPDGERHHADEVLAIFEDREGNLWVGMKNGLRRFRDDPFTSFGRQEGLPSDKPTAVYQDSKGLVWIGYQDAGLVALEPSGARSYTTRDGLPSNEIYSIRETRNHGLLAVTSKGVSQLRRGHFADFFIPPPSSMPPVDVLEDTRGQLWVGAVGGVFAVNGAGLRNVAPSNQVVSPFYSIALALTEDRDGAIWAGTWANGLWRIKNGKTRHFTTSDGLSSDRIRAIAYDPDGTLWIGTNGGGLSEYRDGSFAHYSARDGLLSDNIAQIIDDGTGVLWLATTRGICRIAKKQLHDFRSGKTRALHPTNYATSEGLRSSQCATGLDVSGGGTRTADGRLWFTTAQGVATIMPRETSQVSKRTLAVHIISTTVEGHEFNPDAASPGFVTKVSAGSSHFRFRYIGVNLTAPERVRYELKLDGLDSDWTDAFDRRVIEYRILSYGTYIFRVRATAQGQAPSEAAFSFMVLPRFYQRSYFLWLCFVSLIGAVSGFHWLHLRQMRSRFSLVLEERARIAREIHDTLAQGFVGISSQLEAVEIETINHEGAWRHLYLARKMAQYCLTEARRSIMDLRASAIDNQDLPSALASAVSRWSSMTTAHIQLDTSDTQRALPEEVQTNVFRVAQEAVTNALKHAGAKRICIQLQIQPHTLFLSVKDDGKGFVPCEALWSVEGRLGLLGMRERARKLGGELELHSELGIGAEVRLRVPLALQDSSKFTLQHWLHLVGLRN